MSTKRQWGIYAYTVGFPNAGGFIESSKGVERAMLLKIARKMNSNGDGQRYEVREG